MSNEAFMQTLSSFSGADLLVTFGNRHIGELQSISWAIQREKAPVYTLGSPDPRSFSRGKRGIAGSLIFAVFDRDALMEEIIKPWENNQAHFPKMFTAAGNLYNRQLMDFAQAAAAAGWGTPGADYNSAVEGWNNAANNAQGTLDTPPGFKKLTPDGLMYPDMLPPFDITMTFANEYGQSAYQKIYDVDILNEGSGVSVDTVVMERQMTFIARRISPILQGVYIAGGNS